MGEITVNTIRAVVLIESAKHLARQGSQLLNNFTLKFPSKGRLTLGRSIEKHWVLGGRLAPVLHWTTFSPLPLQQIESECTDREPVIASNNEWQFTDSNQKLRILIVCDAAERLKELQAALGFCQVELFTATSIDELRSIHDSIQFDLAAVDVSPNLIVAVLSFLRNSKACEETTILVESRQTTGNLALAGVLPRFRAMPCSRNDLLRLVCGRIAPESPQSSARKTLF